MLIRKEAGDTLVEVALAMAILGAVIAAAYAVSNRAVRVGVQAKERNEAAQLQQYQAEALRNYRDNYGWTLFKTRMDSVKMTPASYGKTDPCGTDAATSVTDRFYFTTTGSALPKWEIRDHQVNTPSVYRQCIVARPVPDTDPNANKYRFDIHITWEPIGGGETNRSVLTTYLGDIAEIAPAT